MSKCNQTRDTFTRYRQQPAHRKNMEGNVNVAKWKRDRTTCNRKCGRNANMQMHFTSKYKEKCRAWEFFVASATTAEIRIRPCIRYYRRKSHHLSPSAVIALALNQASSFIISALDQTSKNWNQTSYKNEWTWRWSTCTMEMLSIVLSVTIAKRSTNIIMTTAKKCTHLCCHWMNK